MMAFYIHIDHQWYMLLYAMSTVHSMQIREDDAMIFDKYKAWYRHFVVTLKAQGANIVDKPTPMQQADIKKCAENARAGGITPMYGAIVASLKSLCGCRNPVFAAWKWEQIEFIPTAIYNKETGEAEVSSSTFYTMMDIRHMCMHLQEDGAGHDGGSRDSFPCLRPSIMAPGRNVGFMFV